MRAPDALAIDEYVRRLDRSLRGPRRSKGELLLEVRHSLTDSAEEHRANGVAPVEAERLAIAEFGSVPELAGSYQAELAATAARTLAQRVALVGILLICTADLMWRGAPWAAPTPSAGYLLLSGALSRSWIVSALLAVLSYAWLTWTARVGRPGSLRLARAVGLVLTAVTGLCWLGWIALSAWSVGLWHGALTWPPMLIGTVLLAAAYTWLGGTARACLTAARSPAPAGS